MDIPLLNCPDRLIPAHAGKTSVCVLVCSVEGSSPLTRGKHAQTRDGLCILGLIPAHAGKTMTAIDARACRGAHPRSRGENLKQIARDVNKSGSSPLTRGKHVGHGVHCSLLVAHPRSRGENAEPKRDPLGVTGSSPLTRGKRSCRDRLRRRGRLIPAHAGKTSAVCCATVSVEAHPRSRGENHSHGVLEAEAQGSSPLTRGKRGAVDGGRDGLRLIPAHAGKTQATRRRHQRPRAHPRSRGENSVPFLTRIMDGGSSPLTRGKPAQAVNVRNGLGLIPAHAGKTPRLDPTSCSRRAHPRSRGENEVVHEVHPRVQGSSPLTRGKPRRAVPHHQPDGLIPAHAGKTAV